MNKSTRSRKLNANSTTGATTRSAPPTYPQYFKSTKI